LPQVDARCADSGARRRKSAVSWSVTKSEASAARATWRSKSSNVRASRRYTDESGHQAVVAYWRHFSESTSTKSTIQRSPGRGFTYCAIADENTRALATPAEASVRSTQACRPASR
jgi:hypothetical protein